MDKFIKITTGYVSQTYEKNSAGEFVCIKQEFTAGDQVEYRAAEGGNLIAPNKYTYQPFHMIL